MTRTAYTVIARFNHESVRDEYVAWLQGGHIARVIAGGAETASIVVIDRETPDQSMAVEVRYVFPSRESLARYIERHAPALRAEGLARFPPERGVTFQRTIGEMI
ncbi:MAG: DUF4286 family protein [Phycisphaerae bacterium]|nr:DUF4286 family protein [Phycisphaerae bacterium]